MLIFKLSDQQAIITVNCFNIIFTSKIHELKHIDIVFLHVLLIYLKISPCGYLSEFKSSIFQILQYYVKLDRIIIFKIVRIF